ncbi:hypothetical protein AB1Y20_000770 [Prymnesium parvum]|uniref:Major facilitator superfamily (MFS) profile domain-containing protein n=1 Tax=Prymnesium parvum TaxID=97485 RepID=A0AB34KBD6_PRYPA
MAAAAQPLHAALDDFAAAAAEEPRPARSSRVAAISALSNLSIQYNFSAIAVALALMDNGDHNGASAAAAYPRTELQSSLLKSLVFAGAILGQFSMGVAGDVLGRRRAMLLTNGCAAAGAVGTALLTWGSPPAMYTVMGLSRFVLGVGVGGKYPLAASMSKEDSSGGASSSSTQYQVAKGFFWQSPGAMLPYVVGLVLLWVFGPTHYGSDYLSSTSFQFRFLLGIGALPTIAAAYLTYRSDESEEFTESKSLNPVKVAVRHPELFGRLVGCGVSWCLYDFIYYGTSFNQVAITNAVFGKADALVDICWQNAVITAMGLPGVVGAIALLHVWSAKQLQLWGFLFLGLSSLALAVATSAGASAAVKFLLFGILVIALNWGVNVSTYVLPAEVFPTEVRATFFGLSAAFGKVGALVGSAAFKSIQDAVDLDGVYYVCAGVCLLGMLITHLFIPPATGSSPRPFGEEHGVERIVSASRSDRLLHTPGG